jgi:hypothetical protein
MKCPVCFSTWDDAKGVLCPQCHFDPASADAHDSQKILQAREAFKEKATAYDPNSRVTRLDVLKPWFAVVLGFVIFCLWLRACATHGRMF